MAGQRCRGAVEVETRGTLEELGGAAEDRMPLWSAAAQGIWRVGSEQEVGDDDQTMGNEEGGARAHTRRKDSEEEPEERGLPAAALGAGG